MCLYNQFLHIIHHPKDCSHVCHGSSELIWACHGYLHYNPAEDEDKVNPQLSLTGSLPSEGLGNKLPNSSEECFSESLRQ